MNRRRRLLLTMLGGGAAAPAFAPTDVSGMVFWYDAGDPTTLYQDTARTTPVSADGQNIAGWADKSGNGNHLTESEGGPLYKINVRNGLSVARSDENRTISTASSVAHGIGTGDFYLIMALYQGTPAGDTDGYWQNGDNHPGFVSYPGSSGALGFYDGGYKVFSKTVSAATPYILEFYRENGVAKLRVNGVADATTFAYANNIPDGITRLFYGAFGVIEADIFEVALFNTLPSAANQTALQNYMNTRWAVFSEGGDPITLPPGGAVHYVPSGGNIAAEIAKMGQGDILELAENGSYTLAGDEQGFYGLPSGYEDIHTRVHGNGATINYGMLGFNLGGKQYVDVQDVVFKNSHFNVVSTDNCSDITFTDCRMEQTEDAACVDMVKIYRTDNITFRRCVIYSTTGGSTNDGFEFWGPCDNVLLEDCEADVGGIDTNAYEIYGQTALEVCSNVHMLRCAGINSVRGFICNGGPDGLAIHINVLCEDCTVSGNSLVDYEGSGGCTLYRHNSPGTTSGSVVDL